MGSDIATTAATGPARRVHGFFALLIAVALLLLLAPVPAAQAGQTIDRIFAGDPTTVIGFGSPPAKVQDTVGTAEDRFNSPQGIAFNDPGIADGSTDPQGDSTDGYLYVVDRLNHRVQVFDAAGDFKFTFGRGVLTGADGAEVCDHTQTPCTATIADDEQGEFSGPYGIAIDQPTGDLYVRDTGNYRVQQFKADGTFVRAWGWGVDDGSAAFQVCDAPTDLPCQAGIAGASGGQFAHVNLVGATTGPVAIDPNVPHHIFVGDSGHGRVQEFEPDGDFVRLWGWNVVPPGQPGDLGAVFEICSSTAAGGCQKTDGGTSDNLGRLETRHPKYLVIDASGTLYADNSPFSGSRVERFDTNAATPGSLVRSPLQPGSGSDPSRPLLPGMAGPMAIDPDSGNLLTTRNSFTVQEFDVSVEPPVEVDRHLEGGGIAPDGLVSAAGDLHLSSDSEGHRVLAADADGAAPPSFVFDEVVVNDDEATLSATITPNGPPGFNTTYEFQYSRDGINWTVVPGTESPLGDSVAPIAVSDEISGLEPNSLYRMKLVIHKSFGNPDLESAEQTFISDAVPPLVQTITTSQRSHDSANLLALVNPNNLPTQYWFEWGSDTSYGSRAPIPNGDAGNDFGMRPVTVLLTGLQPETTYHYRVVADNGEEIAPGVTEVAGADATLTTRAAPVATPGERAYELVSPADKLSGVGVGEWYLAPASMFPAGRPAQLGERFASQADYGATLVDAAHAYSNDWGFAERVGDQAGWVTHSPVTHPACAAEGPRGLGMDAVAPDFSLVTWSSNAGLLHILPGTCEWSDGEVSNPTWISDWEGRWEIFGPTELDQVSVSSDAPAGTSVAADGSAVLGTTGMGITAVGGIRGLAGAGDPTHFDWPDLVAGRTVYLDDVSAGLSDSLPGAGIREPVHVCTAGTELPTVSGSGDMIAQACAAPGAGRDARLVSEYGATTTDRSSEPPEGTLSADGSHAFFIAPDPWAAASVPDGRNAFCTTAGQTCPAQLFVWQRNPDGSRTTRWISRAEEGLFGTQDASLTGTARFEGATPDGDKVFFRTNSPLTADDPNGTGAAVPGGVKTGQASNSSWDLYMYDMPDGAGADPAGGELTRISSGPQDSDCNRPQNGIFNSGALRFASDDGSRVYFVCAAPLAGVDAPLDAERLTTPGGTPATTTQANLYLYDANLAEAERWRFVARMPAEFDGDGLDGCATAGTKKTSSLSHSTGDTKVGLNGEDVHCVRGTTDGQFISFWTRGQLLIDDPDAGSADIYAYDAASDELSRASAPQGGAGGTYECVQTGPGAGLPCFGDPGFDNAGTGLASQPLDPGTRQVFFQSRSQLVPEDQDGAYDVYAWRDGALDLVSTGVSNPNDGAVFLGNDVTGRNVYFATRDALTWQDTDAVADVYTARVGSGIAEPVPSPLCAVLAGGCKGAPQGAPIPNGAASAAFAGAGNVVEVGKKPRKRCGKGKVARKGKCVPRKTKKRAANGKGRAGR